MTYQNHINDSEAITARCAVLTISDTRTTETDLSGRKIIDLLEAASHAVVHYQIVNDDVAVIEPVLESLLGRDTIDLIVSNGGTGISQRDRTVDIVQQLIEQPLPGFGELFRMLSHEQIGSGAMLSRATAGIARGKPVFAMPGSPDAVELAMNRLIVPEIKHLLRELRKR